jgi:hypothetical protein
VAFDLIAELEVVVDAFEREQVQYAVCGGIALGLHGFVRHTKDIDILVPESELDGAMNIVRLLGFDLPVRKMTFGLAAGTPRTVQRLSKMDSESGVMLTLDLLVVAPDLEDVWKTRIRTASRERELWVVSRDGLVTMKQIAGRPQDLVDIQRLLSGDQDEES